MLLSKPDILAYLREGKLRFEPSIGEDRVAQVSVDLKLGNKFTTFKQPPHYLPCIHVDPSLWDSADLWEHRQSDTFRLEPGGFVLAQTLESVHIPPDLAGFVEGRSSWARVGVTIRHDFNQERRRIVFLGWRSTTRDFSAASATCV